MSEEGLDIAQQRSPKYPYIALDTAVERIRKIFGTIRDTAQPRDVVAQAYGKPVTSSATIQTFATLLQYGLLETVQHSSGQRRLRVSNAAKAFTNPNAPEHVVVAARKTAALAPPIFQELWTTFGPAEGLHDSAPLYYLTHDRAHLQRAIFTERAAQDVLRTYRATLSFADLSEADRLGQDEAGEAAVESEEVREEVSTVPGRGDPAPDRNADRRFDMSLGERELQTGMLSKTAAYRVVVSGPIGVKEIERLIRRLEMDKEILADDSVSDTDT